MPIKEYGILFNCPDAEERRLWLTKVIEEEGEVDMDHARIRLEILAKYSTTRKFRKNASMRSR